LQKRDDEIPEMVLNSDTDELQFFLTSSDTAISADSFAVARTVQ